MRKAYLKQIYPKGTKVLIWSGRKTEIATIMSFQGTEKAPTFTIKCEDGYVRGFRVFHDIIKAVN